MSARLLFELFWCQVAEGLVRSFLIILLSERLTKDLCLLDTGEERSRQKLVSETGVEALPKSILPGTARCDEMAAGSAHPKGGRTL